MWLTGNLQDVVLRVDPRVVGGVARTVVHLPSGIFVAPDSVWVTARQAGTNGHLIRLNPITGVVKATIPVGRDPGPVVAGDGFAWVANEADHTLSRIDANTTSVVSTIPVIERPIGIAIGRGAVWVASRGAPLVSRPSVSRVDTRTGVVVETIPIDDASPFAMTAGADALWIASHNPDEVVRIGPVPLPANVAQASPPAVSVVMFGLVTTLVLVAVGVRGSSGHHSGSRSRLAGYLLSELLLARQGRRQDHAAVGNAERPAPELRT